MTGEPKLIVIVGPTSSGKSELAVKLAKKLNGEIISADSRQVYRGLDIGTGKVPGKWVTWKPRFQVGNGVSKYIYKRIPHYCIDFVPPKKTCTVAEYKKCAEDAIKDITSRGKIPILCGGTGFWIDAVVYDMNLPEVPPNPKLRRELNKKSAGELLKILQKLDPGRAKTVEQKNPRRLIRAIEIAKALGRVPPVKRRPKYDTLWLGLNPLKEVLEKRIKERAKKMIKSGIISETKKLLRAGVFKKRIREFGFEYRAALDYIDDHISKKELRERLVKATLQYARRQMTWFKRNKEICWVTDPRKFLQKKILPSPKK